MIGKLDDNVTALAMKTDNVSNVLKINYFFYYPNVYSADKQCCQFCLAKH